MDSSRFLRVFWCLNTVGQNGGAGYNRHVNTIQICPKGVLETTLALKNHQNQFQDPTIHKN